MTTQQGTQSPTNLLNKYKNNTTTTVTQQKESNNQSNNEPVRTYIPSPMGVQLTNKTGEDLTAANDALHRADIAEQEALKTLKMN